MIYKIKKIISLFIFAAVLLFGRTTFAFYNSKIYFTSSALSIAPGSTITTNVFLDTSKIINALDIEIKYSKDKLKFVNYNNTDSIVSIWQNSPSILPDGNIGFSGGLFKPFIGTKGLIIQLSFKVLNIGQSELSFSKNDIFLADGKGTKTEVSSIPITFFSTKNSPIIILPRPQVKDVTPPALSLILVKSPADGSSLLVFDANDKESGIKETDMRIKKWWSFSDWRKVQNPILYPAGVWAVEVKAINNADLESIKSLSIPEKLYIKVLPIFGIIILLFLFIMMYNKKRRQE